jgi:transcriptional regulator with XRE-family HTH domain
VNNPPSDIRIRDNVRVAEEQLREVLARNVAARMAKLDLTQEALERRAGLGQSTVSRVLTKGGSATLKSLAALAKALECQAWELLVDDEATREAAMRKILRG